MSGAGPVVGVSDLLRQPGGRREVRRTLESPGYRVGSTEVPEGADVDLDLVLEATADPGTLALTGIVRAPWAGECRRCLERVEGELAVDVREIFSRAPEASSDDDVWPIDDEQIDLGAVVADVILLELPLTPLCGPDCRGPAPDLYPARPAEDGPSDAAAGADDDASGDDAGPPRDPRWAALDELRFD